MNHLTPLETTNRAGLLGQLPESDRLACAMMLVPRNVARPSGLPWRFAILAYGSSGIAHAALVFGLMLSSGAGTNDSRESQLIVFPPPNGLQAVDSAAANASVAVSPPATQATADPTDSQRNHELDHAALESFEPIRMELRQRQSTGAIAEVPTSHPKLDPAMLEPETRLAESPFLSARQDPAAEPPDGTDSDVSPARRARRAIDPPKEIGPRTSTPSVSSQASKKSQGVETIAPPQKVYSPDPEYPPALRDARIEGVVVLKVRVAPDGSVEDVAVLRSSGYGAFDRSALAAVKRWKFASDGHRSDGVSVKATLRFVIDDSPR